MPQRLDPADESNDYSVFTLLIKSCIRFCVMLGAPFLLFNLSPSIDGLSLTWDNIQISILVSLSLSLIVLTWFLVDLASGNRYVAEVQKWIACERNKACDLHSILADTGVHADFGMRLKEVDRVLGSIAVARGQEFTFWASLDASGAGFDWIMTLIYFVVLIFAPVITGVYNVPFGQLLILLTVVTQSQQIVNMFSEVRERMRVARIVIGILADLLNDARDHVSEITKHSLTQVSFIRPICLRTQTPIVCLCSCTCHLTCPLDAPSWPLTTCAALNCGRRGAPWSAVNESCDQTAP